MVLKETFRKDYKVPEYKIENVNLNFLLGEEVTIVLSKLNIIPIKGSNTTELLLHGQKDVILKELKLNGEIISKSLYSIKDDNIIIKEAPKSEFILETKVEIRPQDNTILEGLYKSNEVFCTQCEPEGFRGITYFIDRPDIMSKYEVRIEGDKTKYPVLLSNGNLIEEGNLENNRHYAIWKDPFLKPSYLFALVAGDLAVKEDYFITKSEKKVQLRIYADKKNINKVDYAMLSLKQAMKWDEDRFGREYDLDLFNIVAVDDFTMGAMENKSLNIFNSKLLLATRETVTDSELRRIQGIIGHEYFHNWTGNRVTCRDWFQLTLKEGLTVFRDSEFTSDLNSAPLKRIDEVVYLRSSQFSEDASPMAHPIRPDSYLKMDNFYTDTVYRKGSQIIRIYKTILGKDGFRKGLDLYFERHDGQAVTCEDFLAAMADANNKDLSSILKWYGQAGTPNLTITPEYDTHNKIYKLHVSQGTPPTVNQLNKIPVLIPIRMALFDKSGKELELKLKNNEKNLGTQTVLEFDEASKTYEFENIHEKPFLSALRDFSAPVRMTVVDQTIDDLIFLFGNDTDPFNRWESGQILCKRIIFDNYQMAMNLGPDKYYDQMKDFISIPNTLYESFKKVLLDENLDGNLKSMALSLPLTSELIGDIKEADPIVLTNIIGYISKQIAIHLKDDFDKVMRNNEPEPNEKFSMDIHQAGRRAIRNSCLIYLTRTGDDKYIAECERCYKESTNMTDTMACLTALNNRESRERKRCLDDFYNKWKDDYIVKLKWLALKASSNIPGNINNVKELLSHEAYNIKNPNCNYMLLGGFTQSTINFHAPDGSGYEFFTDALLKVDALNGLVATRLAKPFSKYRLYDKQRQELMLKQLKKMNEMKDLSEHLKELVSKSLDL